MTAITDAHTEWALIERLGAMLAEPPHEEYNVTQSYALCMAILAWVMQRIRTPENQAQSPEARAAVAVKHKLEQQRAEDLLWGVRAQRVAGVSSRAEDFADFSACKFLIWLRDATCHGDARQVFPVNKGHELIGFEFRVKGRDDVVRTISLHERDLRRIGQTLARTYCDALQAVSTHPSDFASEARALREKRRAA